MFFNMCGSDEGSGEHEGSALQVVFGGVAAAPWSVSAPSPGGGLPSLLLFSRSFRAAFHQGHGGCEGRAVLV